MLTSNAIRTLGNCTACSEQHLKYQQCFPLKPTYQPEPAISIDRKQLQKEGTKKFTRKALSELNTIYEDEMNTSFEDALAKDRAIALERKKSQSEKKKRET